MTSGRGASLHTRSRRTRLAIWLPGLLVASGAAVATAHGLYEVAIAARVPPAIAWLYPLMTDGLALLAYTATALLAGPGRRYAWLVVVLAAGLSGLAQASYLAGGGALVAPAPLRFAIGAWPAVAAAIVAHLLYLLVVDEHRPGGHTPNNSASSVQQPVQPAVQDASNAVRPAGHNANGAPRPPITPLPPRERARAAARHHLDRHGALPTVTALARLADVSRGTAGHALQDERADPRHHHAEDPELDAED